MSRSVVKGSGGAIAWLKQPRVRLALTVVASTYILFRWYALLTSSDPILAADSYTYWSAPYSDPYAGPQLGLPGAYLYPPPFIQALAPLRLLPWEVFHAVWAALGFAALVFLVGPVGGALAITFLSFAHRDLLVGNIHLMLGAAIVIGLRHPAAWAFPILTKLTAGIGVLWFASRGEWRRLAIAGAVSTGIAAASLLTTPELWAAWLDRMRGDSGTAGGPYVILLVARVAVAGILVLYAGSRGRAWLIPIATVIALPILWPDGLAILLACFPLLVADMRDRRTTDAPAGTTSR